MKKKTILTTFLILTILGISGIIFTHTMYNMGQDTAYEEYHEGMDWYGYGTYSNMIQINKGSAESIDSIIIDLGSLYTLESNESIEVTLWDSYDREDIYYTTTQYGNDDIYISLTDLPSSVFLEITYDFDEDFNKYFSVTLRIHWVRPAYISIESYTVYIAGGILIIGAIFYLIVDNKKKYQ